MAVGLRMRSVQIVRYGVNHLKDNFVSVCFSDRWSGSDETSPPAARGAVERSTDTRPLEWFLSPSSAILCEGEECPQHGLERLALRRLWVLIYASPSQADVKDQSTVKAEVPFELYNGCLIVVKARSNR